MQYLYEVMFPEGECGAYHKKELLFDAPVAKGDILNLCESWGSGNRKVNDPDVPDGVQETDLWSVVYVIHYFDKDVKKSRLLMRIEPLRDGHR